jgi:hypothetical protein
MNNLAVDFAAAGVFGFAVIRPGLQFDIYFG